MKSIFKFGVLSAFGLGLVTSANIASAHHSFAIYDLENPIIITGELKSLKFANPHTILVVEVDGQDQNIVWSIESMAPGRWDSTVANRDIADVGQTVTIRGWPAKSGSAIMALGTVTSPKGVTVVRETIIQNRPVEGGDAEAAELDVQNRLADVDNAEEAAEGAGRGGMGGGMGDGAGMGDGGAGMGGGMGAGAGMGDGGAGMGGGMQAGGTQAAGMQGGGGMQGAAPVATAPTSGLSIWAILGGLLVLALGVVAILKRKKS